MIRFARHYKTRLRRDPEGTPAVRYYVTFYSQPRWRYLAARVYHWYDMNKVVHWIAHRLPERAYGHFQDGTTLTMPFCVEQDERCDALHHKERVELGMVEIDKDLYDKLGRSET